MNENQSNNKTVDNLNKKIYIESNISKTKAIGYLKFTSELILLFSIIIGLYILFTKSYINIPEYIGGVSFEHKVLNVVGIMYGLATIVYGIFISSLGFTVAYIAKNISKNNE